MLMNKRGGYLFRFKESHFAGVPGKFVRGATCWGYWTRGYMSWSILTQTGSLIQLWAYYVYIMLEKSTRYYVALSSFI